MLVNHKLYNKYKSAIVSRREDQINEIVIHGTAGGGSADDLIKWMLSGERSAEYEKGEALFHYLIDFDGTITNLIPDLGVVYHSSAGKHDRYTIGIELMNTEKDNSGEYTDDQYESLKVLTYTLLSLFPITSITGHERNAQIYSNIISKKVPCPGNFEWNRIDNWLNANNMFYRKNEEGDKFYEIAQKAV